MKKSKPERAAKEQLLQRVVTKASLRKLLSPFLHLGLRAGIANILLLCQTPPLPSFSVFVSCLS